VGERGMRTSWRPPWPTISCWFEAKGFPYRSAKGKSAAASRLFIWFSRRDGTGNLRRRYLRGQACLGDAPCSGDQ
jgi:hypothetical protein